MNLGTATVSSAIADLNGHALIMPVANQTARAAYEQEMRDKGRPPSPSNPLYVDRADTGAVERNRGAGWVRFVDNTLQTHTPVNNDPLWRFANIIYKKNGMVTARIRANRLQSAWNGQRAEFWPNLPTAFRPPAEMFFPVFVHHRTDQYRSAMFRIETDGAGALQGTMVGAGNAVSGVMTWPSND